MHLRWESTAVCLYGRGYAVKKASGESMSNAQVRTVNLQNMMQ